MCLIQTFSVVNFLVKVNKLHQDSDYLITETFLKVASTMVNLLFIELMIPLSKVQDINKSLTWIAIVNPKHQRKSKFLMRFHSKKKILDGTSFKPATFRQKSSLIQWMPRSCKSDKGNSDKCHSIKMLRHQSDVNKRRLKTLSDHQCPSSESTFSIGIARFVFQRQSLTENKFHLDFFCGGHSKNFLEQFLIQWRSYYWEFALRITRIWTLVWLLIHRSFSACSQED